MKRAPGNTRILLLLVMAAGFAGCSGGSGAGDGGDGGEADEHDGSSGDDAVDAGDDGAEHTYFLTLSEPPDGSRHEVGSPVHFAGTTDCAPATVDFIADGQYPLGSVATADGVFTHDYAFNTPGPARMVTVTAAGASCTAQASVTLEIVPAGPDNPLEVPYFCQYDNGLYPESTCQNTSVAMLLAFYGWNGVPDDITGEWGKDHAQTPSGLAEVFNSYSGPLGVSLTPHTDGTFAGMKSLLDLGRPVIVHGYFTQYGHVVVTLGYDADGYWVNDPAGVWSQVYQGGYSPRYCDSGYSGDTVYYQRAAFEAAIGPDRTLWYHEPSR